MSIIRNIFFLILTIFIFVGSVGVGIYSHFCEKDGVEQSYFVKKTHHCEKQEIETLACCAHEDVEIAKNCCSDELKFVKINLDYFHQIPGFHFVPFQFPTAVFECIIKSPIQTNISNANFANPPPKLGGKELLVHQQVFLI